jgi:hypothetical protein
MATFAIEIADAELHRLQALTDRYNSGFGTSLTNGEFLQLHVLEVLVQEELAAKAEQLRRQAETDVNAAVAAERERLLAAVGAK